MKKKLNNFSVLGCFTPLNSPVRGVYRGFLPLVLNAFGLNLPSQLVIGYYWLSGITGYRVSLVSVPESGSQKSLGLRLKIKVLLNEKKKSNFLHMFQNIAHLLGPNIH